MFLSNRYGNVNKLDFRLEINEKVVQKSNTSDMIFKIDEIVAYVSRFFTLKTGDLIFTGTPSGVGVLKKNDNLVAYLGDKPVLDFMIKYNSHIINELHSLPKYVLKDVFLFLKIRIIIRFSLLHLSAFHLFIFRPL